MRIRLMLIILALTVTGIHAKPNLYELLGKQGLVDVQSIEPSLVVDLKYSSKDNFLKQDVYGDLNACFLYREVALKLQKAQQLLHKKKPGFGLLIYDCIRPRAVQYKMWDLVKGTPSQNYVANPISGSIHNYGAAVDLTVIDEEGKPLDMGTPFDFFGELAQPRHEHYFLKKKKLSAKQYNNRLLLRHVMLKAGFYMINNEWWHFNAFSLSEVKRKFKAVN